VAPVWVGFAEDRLSLIMLELVAAWRALRRVASISFLC